MARQTGTTATATPEPINSRTHPAVVAAGAALAPIRARHDEAVALLAKYHAVLAPPSLLPDPNGNMPIPSPEIGDVLFRMEATANMARAQLDAARAERELLKARQAEDTAREHARVEIAASYAPRLHEAVHALRVALLAAKAANTAVQQTQVEQADACGLPFDPVSVVTLNMLVDDWLARVTAAGLPSD